jgi:hypothetical protein
VFDFDKKWENDRGFVFYDYNKVKLFGILEYQWWCMAPGTKTNTNTEPYFLFPISSTTHKPEDVPQVIMLSLALSL